MDEKSLRTLAESLTIKEKLAQMTQLSGGFFRNTQDVQTGPMKRLNIDSEIVDNVGSVLNIKGADNVIRVQSEHLKRSRNKIPLLFMGDIISGYKTSFPIQVGLGCSWNIKLAEKTAKVTAAEASAAGIHITFSPMVDLTRDPRWGRTMESTGEDPYLNYCFARAMTIGFQGKDLLNPETMGACVKHMAGYGAVIGGREYNVTDISERTLREIYLPPYKGAVDAGCCMVMAAFTPIDGVPAVASQRLLTDILRNEWGFEGVVISDWGTVDELVVQGIANDKGEAAVKSLKAGLDIEMMSSTFVNYLEDMIKKDDSLLSYVNEAVMRILTLKNRLGLFEHPFRGASKEKETKLFFCEKHRETAREAARESIVLLKNENNILPINRHLTIGLTGPYADSQHLSGLWSLFGDDSQTVTIRKGLEDKGYHIVFAEGCSIAECEKKLKESFYFAKKKTTSSYQEREELKIKQFDWKEEQRKWEEAAQVLKDTDVIVLALGEHILQSGEGGSRTDLTLPQNQIQFFEMIRKLGKPVVTLLFSGRPIVLNEIMKSDAIVQVWFPGTEGGNAVADVVSGDVSPSGKLCMSFPQNTGQIPVYYNHYITGRPKEDDDVQNRFKTGYIDCDNSPLFEFGYGLSYTKFEYDNLVVSDDGLVTVEVTNVGTRKGKEIVELYIHTVSADVIRPVKELKDFKKIELEVGETQKVSFQILDENLYYYDSEMHYGKHHSKVEIYVGTNTRECLKATIEI